MNQSQRLSIRNNSLRQCSRLGTLLLLCGCIGGVTKIKSTDIDYSFSKLPTGQSDYGRGQQAKVVEAWPTPFYTSAHKYSEEGYVYLLEGKFDYNRFVTTDAYIDSEESVLNWEDVEGRCRKRCTEVVLDPHTPLELIYWFSLFYWMNNQDVLSSTEAQQQGFGVVDHDTKSLVKDFTEEDVLADELSQSVDAENIKFMLQPGVWCSSKSRSYMADVVGTSNTDSVSAWLENNGYSLGVNAIAESSNIARARNSIVQMNQKKSAQGYAFQFYSEEQYEAGSNEAHSEVSYTCIASEPMYARDMMNFTLSYVKQTNLGWHFQFGLR